MSNDTSSELRIFTAPFAFGDLRTLVLAGEPWFVAADVCALIALGNTSMALGRLDDDEKGVSQIDTPGGRQQMAIVSESGMYNLILRSDKPEARPFRRWVTHDVLPAIRRTGGYAVPQQRQPELEIPADYAGALRLAADQFERAELATARAIELEPSAAAWDKLATATGDYAVADAAKILSRDPAIRIGRDRLFTLLRAWRWI